MGIPITPVTSNENEQTQRRLTIQPMITPFDGSAWAFDGRGYTRIVDPWTNEAHIAPFRAQERLGSVEAWCAYVLRFATTPDPLLTWSAAGLRAVLDCGTIGDPGRGQVFATHPFERTRQWTTWEQLADGRHRSQRQLVEALEDRRDDIRDPDAATIVGLLRAMRATVNSNAEAMLGENGETEIKYQRQTSTSLVLPPTITIGIPVLKGHTAPDENGIDGPVRYELDVRIRVDVLDEGKIAFRLTMPNAEQALEDAVAERVRAAQTLLDEHDPVYELLRAAS